MGAPAHCPRCDAPYADRTGRDPCPRCGEVNTRVRAEASARLKAERADRTRGELAKKAESARVARLAAEASRPMPEVEPEPDEPAAPVRRGTRWELVAMVFFSVAGLVGGVAWWVGQGRRPEPIGPPAVPSRPDPSATPAPAANPSSQPSPLPSPDRVVTGEKPRRDEAEFEAMVTEEAKARLVQTLTVKRGNGAGMQVPVSDEQAQKMLDRIKVDVRSELLAWKGMLDYGAAHGYTNEEQSAAGDFVLARPLGFRVFATEKQWQLALDMGRQKVAADERIKRLK